MSRALLLLTFVFAAFSIRSSIGSKAKKFGQSKARINQLSPDDQDFNLVSSAPVPGTDYGYIQTTYTQSFGDSTTLVSVSAFAYNLCIVSYKASTKQYQSKAYVNPILYTDAAGNQMISYNTSTYDDSSCTSLVSYQKDTIQVSTTQNYFGDGCSGTAEESTLVSVHTILGSDVGSNLNSVSFTSGYVEYQYVGKDDCNSQSSATSYDADATIICDTTSFATCGLSKFVPISGSTYQLIQYQDKGCETIELQENDVIGDNCYAADDDIPDEYYGVYYTQYTTRSTVMGGGSDDDDSVNISKGSYATLILFVILALFFGMCGGYGIMSVYSKGESKDMSSSNV